MKASIALSIRVTTLAALVLLSVMLASAQGSSCPVSPAYSPTSVRTRAASR